MKLRSHQRELQKIVDDINPEQMPFKILADIVPGGGKSMFPAIIARRFPNHKIAWYVPRVALQHQGALNTLQQFNITLRETDGNEIRPARDTRGFISTHASLGKEPKWHSDEIARDRYIVIVDEVHHAKINHDGTMNTIAAALETLRPDGLVLMTGTLETSDNKFIWGVPYRNVNNQYEVDVEAFKNAGGHFIKYTRSHALNESAIVPLHFHQFDGEVEWEDHTASNGAQNSGRKQLSELNRDEASKGVFTFLRTPFAHGLFQSGVDHWLQHSNGGQLLVVVPPRPKQNDKAEYEPYVEMLRAQGISTGLAVVDNDAAHPEIRQFRNGELRALVTVAMAYEGLDVPAITHLVCLTNIRSAPWIEQMLARAWRRNDAAGKQVAHAFIPQDPLMMRVVQKIKDELDAAVREPGEDPPPPPGEQVFVIPIGGEITSITQEALDGQIEYTEAERQIVAVLQTEGLDKSNPDVAHIMNQIAAILRKQQPRVSAHSTQRANGVTEREREELVRADNKMKANALNRARIEQLGIKNPTDLDWSFHQTSAVQAFGISTTKMGLSTLLRVNEFYAKLLRVNKFHANF